MELKTQRNSNIELLRIIAMLMIIAHHYVTGSLPLYYLTGGPNKWLSELLYSYGKTGVNIFVLITGYYMVNMNFSIKKPLKIMGQVWFYSVMTLLVCLMIPSVSEQLDGYQIFGSFFPISTNQYWFATQYILLLTVAPFLNRFAHNASKDQLTVCVIVLAVFNSVVPSVHAVLTEYLAGLTYSPEGWFVMLYLMAARIRLYSPDCVSRKELCSHALRAIAWGIAIPAWAWVSQIVFGETGNETFFSFLTWTQMDWSFFGLMCALELFQLFRLMKPFYRRWINLLASFSFGVYLFHAHVFYPVIRNAIFSWVEPAHAVELALQALIVVFGRYLAGSVADFVRQKTVGRLWNKAVDKASPSIERWGCAAYRKISALIDRSV